MEIKAKHILMLGAFIVLTVLGYKLLPKDEMVLLENSENNINEQNIVQEKNTIFVHIEGAINNTGVQEIEEGTRLFELIEICGGVTYDADLSKINLASVLKDEQKIIIPFQKKIEENLNEYNKYEEENKLININSASIEELQKLEGIGPGMAQNIIDYRDENGYFIDIEDLKNVSGIGEAKFSKIKEDITV